ncbi:MAG: hypothetical protein M1837_001841 [Sclerophora amabilis]|nr:MAG: hypothetical protein M1837_001841 [Sclerophora amabilis]
MSEDESPAPIKRRGRPTGSLRKRKADNELSSNTYSQKRRSRLQSLTQIESELEQAKNNDCTAKNRNIRTLKARAEWKAASEDEKKRLENEVRENVDVQEVSANALEIKYGYGKRGGLYAKIDDGNPIWEDEDNNAWDPMTEARWRQNNLQNEGYQPEMLATEAKERAAELKSSFQERLAMITWRAWQRQWRTTFWEYADNLKELERAEPMPEWPEWHFVEGVLYQHVLPHLFFTSDQIKVWKNMAH